MDIIVYFCINGTFIARTISIIQDTKTKTVKKTSLE